MDREEAKKSIAISYDEDDHNLNMMAIDIIYDDFESRTCSNCEWFTNYSCGKATYEFPTDKDFGCNKFESKEK